MDLSFSKEELEKYANEHKAMSERVLHKDELAERIVDPRRMKGRITAIDPMSPYTPPVSPTGFTGISDIINRKQYSGMYPQSYGPVPEYFRKFGLTPYYEPESFNDFAHGVMTIATMIELTFNNQPWKLDREQDIKEVYELSKQYYTAISDPKYDNISSIKIYREKMSKFNKVLSKSVDKIYHRDKKFNFSNGLFDILAKMAGARERNVQ